MLENLLPGVQHLQNPHPLFVHFPIAFLMGAALFYLISWSLRKETLSGIAFWLLILGALSSVVAAATGLYSEEGVMVSRSVRENLLVPHERLMLTTLLLSLLLAFWAFRCRPFPRKGRPIFVLLFLILLGILVKGADYGGRMVYDYNAGGEACPQPIDFKR